MLQAFLDQHQIEAKILQMPEVTPTVPDAARVLGIEVDQVIKSLVFKSPDGPFLVVSCGVKRVDDKLLAEALGHSKRKVKFVRAEAALDITGYVVGSMPPFGHLTKLPTLVDERVTKHALVYGGGGTLDTMLEVSLEELLRVTEAKVLTLS